MLAFGLHSILKSTDLLQRSLHSCKVGNLPGEQGHRNRLGLEEPRVSQREHWNFNLPSR